MAKTEISISNNWQKKAKVMILRNDKTRTPLAAKSENNSAEIERQTEEKCKTRVSWTVGQLLL